MPFVPVRKFGSLGLIYDTQAQALPSGAWSDGLNMRFSGIEMEKMLEPVLDVGLDGVTGNVQWMQGWSDGFSSYVAIATATDLWFLRGGTWVNATRTTGQYSPDSKWSSFEWGDTCIFNNAGFDVPQIFNPSTLKFEDLPRWGMISTADDIFNDAEPSNDTSARCKFLAPMGNFLVAIGTSESLSGYQPNTVWWSDATTLSTYAATIDGGGPPSWDYESPATLSGKRQVGVGDGPLKTAVLLNDNLILYCESSANAMQIVGGSAVMDIRRLFNKGAAGQHCVVEYNNRHFCLSTSQLYSHDGSIVSLLGKDRIDEELFRRLGVAGRYEGPGGFDWDWIQAVKDPGRREIYLNYSEILPDPPAVPICKVYDCSAYITALKEVAKCVWVMDDAVDSNTLVNAVNPAWFLGSFGQPLLGVTMNNAIDECEATPGGKLVASIGWRSNQDSGTSEYITSTSGTIGAVLDNDGGPDMEIMGVRLNGASFKVAIDLASQFLTVRIVISDTPYYVPTTISVADSRNAVISWTLDDVGNYTVKAYGDFVLDTDVSGVIGPGTTVGTTQFYMGAEGGTTGSSVDAQYAWYMSEMVSPTDINTLKAAWEQNQIGYVDPRYPDCKMPDGPVLPTCQVYSSTAYKDAIDALQVKYNVPLGMWVMDDGGPNAFNPSGDGSYFHDYGNAPMNDQWVQDSASGVLVNQESFIDDGRGSFDPNTVGVTYMTAPIANDVGDSTQWTYSVVRDGPNAFHGLILVYNSNPDLYISIYPNEVRVTIASLGVSQKTLAIATGQVITVTVDGGSGHNVIVTVYVNGVLQGTVPGLTVQYLPGSGPFQVAIQEGSAGAVYNAQYSWLMAGLATLPDIELLYQEFERNKSGYVDPRYPSGCQLP